MQTVLAFWRSATADERTPQERIKHWPSEIAVTKAGFAGRVHPYPGGLMDPGHIEPHAYDDSEDHQEARKKFEPVTHTPEMYTFGRRIGLFPQRWHDMDKEKVDLSQPIHAMQPHLYKDKLKSYLDNPEGKTTAQEKFRGADDQTQKAIDHYPFTHHPGFIKYQGRLHVVDGHHRVAAAMMRGDSHIEGKVYDADKHGFPADQTLDHGWDDKDPGPPR